MILVSLFKYSWYFYSLYIVIKNKDKVKHKEKDIKRLENAIYDCGPMGVKLIQFLLMYEEFLPKEITCKLDFTLEQCKQHLWSETTELYLKNFNKDIYTDFEIKEDDNIVIGSGSIGQVYKLYNKELQKYVAVKVRHPNINNEICEFVKIINIVTRILGKICIIPYVNIIHIFKNNIAIQNDFITEAKNTIQLRNNFTNEHNIIIPEVYTYTDDFIIMSYHEGVPIDKINNKVIKYAVSNDINFIILSSIMIYNFLHADLHNGNWKIQVKEDNKYNIVIYDCGLIAKTHSIKLNKELMVCVMVADYTTFIRLLDEIYIPKQNELPSIKETKLINIRLYIDEINKDTNLIASERFLLLIKYAINNDIIREPGVICLLLSLLMTANIHILGLDRNQKFFGTSPNKNDISLIFCTYIGLLNRMKKYEELKLFIIEYINSDTKHKEIFLNWLYDKFGHTDEDIFYDIIAKCNGLENKINT